MKHTPGPWSYTARIDEGYRIHQGNYMVDAIADVDEWMSDEEAEANARLIAAAPSMKQALEAIADMQVQKDTDFRELAALCVSIARIELEKLK